MKRFDLYHGFVRLHPARGRGLAAKFGLAAGLCLAVGGGFAACSDDTVEVGAREFPAPITVSLNIGQQPAATTGEVRATSPLTPDVENFIYDLWVLQFVTDGKLSQLAKSQHLRINDGGTTSVTGLTAELYPLKGYVCIIANRNPGNEKATFADIFDSGTDTEACEDFDVFRLTPVTLDLTAINSGGVDKVLMCGSWSGTPTTGQILSVQLGRMLARLNVTLENETGALFDKPTKKNGLTEDTRLTSTLSNAATRTLLYPTTDANDWAEVKQVYTTLTDTELSLDTSAYKTIYYYVAPNYDAPHATTIQVTNKNSQTGVIVLGTNAPGSSNRDLNLYQNTIYNYTITLK